MSLEHGPKIAKTEPSQAPTNFKMAPGGKPGKRRRDHRRKIQGKPTTKFSILSHNYNQSFIQVVESSANTKARPVHPFSPQAPELSQYLKNVHNHMVFWKQNASRPTAFTWGNSNRGATSEGWSGGVREAIESAHGACPHKAC